MKFIEPSNALNEHIQRIFSFVRRSPRVHRRTCKCAAARENEKEIAMNVCVQRIKFDRPAFERPR